MVWQWINKPIEELPYLKIAVKLLGKKDDDVGLLHNHLIYELSSIDDSLANVGKKLSNEEVIASIINGWMKRHPKDKPILDY